MEKLGYRLLALALFCGATFVCAYSALQSVVVSAEGASRAAPRVVVDAGHGGEDGGASSAEGTPESALNLQIALRLRDLFALCGIEPVMIRETDTAVYTGDCTTISQKKVSDLKNRVKMTTDAAPALLLSLHQNFFEQTKYRGAQVFFAKTAGSEQLAERIQHTLRTCVDPANHRRVKPSQGVYLMEHITCTGVLVECGFLSNAEEAKLLESGAYQKKLSLAVCGAITEYLSENTEKGSTDEV